MYGIVIDICPMYDANEVASPYTHGLRWDGPTVFVGGELPSPDVDSICGSELVGFQNVLSQNGALIAIPWGPASKPPLNSKYIQNTGMFNMKACQLQKANCERCLARTFSGAC